MTLFVNHFIMPKALVIQYFMPVFLFGVT